MDSLQNKFQHLTGFLAGNGTKEDFSSLLEGAEHGFN